MRLQYPYPLLLGCLAPGDQSRGDVLSQQYDYSFQLYQEDNGRIRVEAHYLRGQLDITDATTFNFQLLHDAISGSSPTGVLPGGVQPFTSNLEDVREGILGALSHRFGDHKIDLELSKSEENDYLSRGIAFSHEMEFNQKNTTLALGASYLDDVVKVPGLGDRRKESLDIFTGVTQILSKNTVASANLTLGFMNGYLNDPYKVVQRDELFSIGPGLSFPVVNIYRENRPDSRFRLVLLQEIKHYFESAQGTLDATLRLSHDDFGIFAQTVHLEWRQEIGDTLLLIPFCRYYHQSAADFFVNTLNDLPITTPSSDPTGSGPNYSADYRLSSFDAHSFGLRLRYQASESFTLSAAYERYLMNGTGGDSAPSGAYPDANIFTIGARLKF